MKSTQEAAARPAIPVIDTVPMQMASLHIGLGADAAERLIVDATNGTLLVNASAFLAIPDASIASAVREVIGQAMSHAQAISFELRANINPQRLNDDLIASIEDPSVGIGEVDTIRRLLAHYTVQVQSIKLPLSVDTPYPAYDPARHRAVLRYGNVELCVIESYLRDRSALHAALDRLVGECADEAGMYAKVSRSHYLSSEDYHGNLRLLMTNAGFYVERDLASARSTLDEWAERYISALRHCNLASYPAAFPFYFGLQRLLWDLLRESPSYVQHPTAFDVYSALGGKDVLFMSPMAHLVMQQSESGRLLNLYTRYQMPTFALRALPAWVSTWPNRPHSSWSETFGKMCNSLEIAYRQRPFDVFFASCGCYGLPICEYARERFGCNTIYLGNIAHAFFGIRQATTRGFMKDQTNESAWIDGDLGRFANMGRIDAGRYV